MTELRLLQHYAGQALTGVLSSPDLSSTALSVAIQERRENEDTQYFQNSVARLAWNIAEAMVREGKERGHILS